MNPLSTTSQRRAAGEPITLAIPYHSGLDYLKRAIASVRNQTSDCWRLLICDDSPHGEARAVIESNDPRIAWFHECGSSGMAANWNRCLDRAETDLVTLLHADDELLPHYVDTMRNGAADQPQAAALFCSARVIDAESRSSFSFADVFKRIASPAGRSPRRLRGPRAIARLLRVNSIMCPTVCYRRSRIGARRFDPRWQCALDLDFFTRLLGEGEELVGLPAVAYSYRRHAKNATSGYIGNLVKFAEEADLYDEIAFEAERRGWGEVARVGRAKTILRCHVLFRILVDLIHGRASASAVKMRFLVERLFISRPEPAPCGT